MSPTVLRPALAAGAAVGASLALATAVSAPLNFEVDPTHTFPSFEADHFGGMSVWRGKFNKTAGKVLLDRAAGSGSFDIVVEADSIDFGQEQLNGVARGPQLFDVERFPQARYRGHLEAFVDGAPTRAVGDFTLHGVTRPLTMEIRQFQCRPHPLFKREFCGADAYASFQRDEFGLDYGKSYGFRMQVDLRIQVEAVAAP